jgi:hypothetical protein
MTANDSQVRQAGTSTTAKLADELSEASIASRGFLDRLRPGLIRALLLHDYVPDEGRPACYGKSGSHLGTETFDGGFGFIRTGH